MKTLKYALIGALLFPAMGAVAQDVDAPGMLTGLTMIQTNVNNAFRLHDIDADPTKLTLSQLVEIANVLNDPEMNSGGQSAKMTILKVLTDD